MEVSTDWNSILQHLGQLSLFTILLPIGIALYRKKYLNKPLKVALLYCITTLGLNFVFISAFYVLIFPIKKIKNYIKWIARILTTIAIVNYCFIEGYQSLGILNPLLHHLFIIGFLGFLPAYYFWISQMESIRIPIRKSPYLWISIGLMLPNLLGSILFGIGESLYEGNFILYCQFFSFKMLCEIIGHLLIAVGFSYAYYARFIRLTLHPYSHFLQKEKVNITSSNYLPTNKIIKGFLIKIDLYDKY